MSMHTHVLFVKEYMYVHGTWRAEVDIGGLLQLLSTVSFRQSLTELGAHRFDGADWPVTRRNPSVSACLELWLAIVATVPCFLNRFWNSDSHPYACTASIWPTEQSPQVPNPTSYWATAFPHCCTGLLNSNPWTVWDASIPHHIKSLPPPQVQVSTWESFLSSNMLR